MSLSAARKIAEDDGLDLVLINGGSTPAICKVMDYGKYRFDSLKKEKELKKNQKIVETKEIRLSMTIDTRDIEIKAKNAAKFLQNGDKVKVSLRMSGREMAYAPKAKQVVQRFYEMLAELGTVEKEPEHMGRNIFLMINPKKAK